GGGLRFKKLQESPERGSSVHLETARKIDQPVNVREHALPTLAQGKAGMGSDMLQEERQRHRHRSRVARAVQGGEKLEPANDRLEYRIEIVWQLPKRIRKRRGRVTEEQ